MGAPKEDLTPDLPECVAIAASAAEELYTLVITTSFPELPTELDELPTAVERVVDALQWAERIDEAHHAVVELFPPREEGVEVEIPSPPSRFLGGHPTLLGGGYARGYIPPPIQGPVYGDVLYRSLRMDIASDVLEPVPERYRDSLARAFPFRPSHVRPPFDRAWVGEAVSDEVARSLSERGWPSIRNQMMEARMIVRAKSLGLVAWVRQCVSEMRSATLPSIAWHAPRKYDGQVVEVSLAGASHLVDLSKGEHDLLHHLERGAADASRTTKSKLVKKIPELDPYLVSLGSASPKTSSYAIPQEVARRIDVQPRSQQSDGSGYIAKGH